jgi:hypothetical protein
MKINKLLTRKHKLSVVNQNSINYKATIDSFQRRNGTGEDIRLVLTVSEPANDGDLFERDVEFTGSALENAVFLKPSTFVVVDTNGDKYTLLSRRSNSFKKRA